MNKQAIEERFTRQTGAWLLAGLRRAVQCVACAQAVSIPLLQRFTALECTSYAIWADTLFLLFFSPGLLEELRTAPLQATLAATYLGIFPGALGYVSWAYALSHLPASTTASFLNLVPIVASAIAWLWLGEVPALFALLGGLFVLAGVILVNTRVRKGQGL